MKKMIKILAVLVMVISFFGCSTSDKKMVNTQDTITDSSEMSGKLPTCWQRGIGDTILPSMKNIDNSIEYLTTNFKYPKSAIKNNIEGKIFVQIVIEKNGEVSDYKILRGLSDDCNNEALRVVKTISWNPATVKGTPVKFTMVMPFALVLDKKKIVIL